jgi:hypothetical protein
VRLLIEIRRTADENSKIIELEDPREEWCRWYNLSQLNIEAGRTAQPVSSETRRASSKSLEA